MALNYTPAAPNQYKEDQIILNSGRLLFNAKSDSVLLFASKAIGLSSAGTINLDSDNDIILNSEKQIQLGLNASTYGQPVMLGEITSSKLSEILTHLIALCNSLGPAMAAIQPVPQIQATLDLAQIAAKLQAIQIFINSNGLKSQKTYTL